MSQKQIFINARIYTAEKEAASANPFQECLVIDNDKIFHVGQRADSQVQAAEAKGGEVINLNGRIVVPGFIDSHTHFLLYGMGLQKLDLNSCRSFESIKNAIKQWAADHPDAPRILCRQWHQSATNRKALASMLDDIDSRPIFIEARDCHSTWCNSAALAEIKPELDAKSNLFGNYMHRDAAGKYSGLIEEGAHFAIVWPHLTASPPLEEKLAALDDALKSYIRSGYTGFVDMAMDDNEWDALKLLRSQQGIPLHIAAHWAVYYTSDDTELDRRLDEAIARHREFSPAKSPDFCIVGIKLFADGAIGGCTAAISHPYAESTNLVDPIWPTATLNRIVKRAVDAGLQCAIHAIGDVAISQSIDAIAAANSPQGRHRIEHLQLASVEDTKRLGQLGITASIQGVHSDPVISTAYSRIIKPDLWERAFPFRDFVDHHACVAIGTDTPTAHEKPFPNLYNATTRKSSVDPSLPPAISEKYALTLSQAMAAATSQAAYACFAEKFTGSLTPGKLANFLVLDMEWKADSLLDARVIQTWIKGKKLFDKSDADR